MSLRSSSSVVASGKYLVNQLGALGIYQSQPMIITQILGPANVMIFVVAQKGHHSAHGSGVHGYFAACPGLW
jgi:hypothetical protein